MPRVLSAAVAAAVAFGATAAMPGCVDPQNDYKDWMNRTTDARAGGALTEVGPPVEAGLPDGGFTGTYAMACSTSIGPGAQDATHFVATVTYTPNASGGGTLDYQNHSLVVGATSLSQTVGPPSNNPPVTIGPDGTGTLVFGPNTVPGAANPVNTQDVVFDSDATLHFVVGQGTLCAGLTGHITQPLPITMDPTKGDFCIFIPATTDFPPTTDDSFKNSPCGTL